MDDEPTATAEAQTPPQAPPDTRIAELTQLVAQRDADLAAAATTLDALKVTAEASTAQATDLATRLDKAVIAYRALTVARHPEIPADLLTGSTVEDIDAATVKALELVESIKAKLAGQAAASRVPAGAPPRTGPDLSSMTPREKILYAFSQDAK